MAEGKSDDNSSATDEDESAIFLMDDADAILLVLDETNAAVRCGGTEKAWHVVATEAAMMS